MSDLRDARLERALRSAPDEDMGPAPAIRTSILQTAHAAVAPAAPLAGWRKWWAGMGAVQPWNAAFASVLLAGVITLLWRHEEVPPASGDGAMPPAATTAVPAAPSANASRTGPTEPPAAAKVERRTAPPRTQPPAPAAVQQAPQPALRDAEPAAADRQRADAEGSLAKSAPLPAPQAPAAPHAESTAGAVPRAPLGWDALRVERGARVDTWTRADAAGLAPLLQRATAGDGDVEQAVASGAADLKLEPMRDGRAQGLLEVGADWLRWQPVTGAATVRRDAELATAVRRAVEALPQRP